MELAALAALAVLVPPGAGPAAFDTGRREAGKVAEALRERLEELRDAFLHRATGNM
jgi:hypothetical protein